MKYRVVMVALCLILVFGIFVPYSFALDCGVTKIDVIKSIVAHITHQGDMSTDDVIYLIRANLDDITDCGVPEVTSAISKASLIADSTVPKCNDGTLFAYCSANTPKYCYNGRLVDRCDLCCPSGICYDDGTCEPP